MRENGRLFSFEFLSLNLAIFFAFCNMSVFYSFFNYLARINIPTEWRGFLVGLEPMSAFMLRLVVIPMLHVGNAATAMLIALSMLVVALCSYGWVASIPGLIMLRIFHGAAFVLLVSAGMALVVNFIPKGKSGQGFGFVSVSVLVPYAVMPLLTEIALPVMENEAQIYRSVTVLAAPAFVLLFLVRKRLKCMLGIAGEALIKRPNLDEIRRNLKEPGIVLLLTVNLLVYLGYASVFFFMKSHAAVSGITEVGAFFSIATLVMIALRLSGGLFFDRIDKVRMLQVFMLLLAPCFALFGHMGANRDLYLLACYYGLCIGFIMPLLNASLFDVSPPRLRGVNTNLALFVMDAGFFLGPYAGGAFLAAGHSSASLFNICACLMTINLFLLIMIRNRNKAGQMKTSTEGGR